MKLIDILVQELPKRGGWPLGVAFIVQDYDGEIKGASGHANLIQSSGVWTRFGQKEMVMPPFKSTLADDHRTAIITREQYEAALKQSVWDGTGLPPVGCECERSWCGDKWLRCTVLFISDEMVVVKLTTGEACYRRDEVEFRPIRSERDEAINEIASMIGRGTFYEDAERIYDAGYRKLEKE